MATYTDNFSTYGGSDGNLTTVSSGAWADADFGFYYIAASAYVRAKIGGAYNTTAYNQTVGNDQYAECTVPAGTAVNNASWGGPAVRVNTANGAAYILAYQRNGASSRISIAYYDGSGLSGASSWTNLGSELSTSAVLRLEVSGSDLTGKVDGVTQVTWTDSSLTSGKAGLGEYAWAANTDYYFDNWGGGDLAGDTTPPVLSSPTGSETGMSTAVVGATTDEGNGTLYAVVTTSNTQPSVAQIKAGDDHTGSDAAFAGSVGVSSTGAKTINATGLSAATTYYAHLVQTDAAANDSNRVTSASFTTNAALTKKLKLKTTSSAASASSIAGVVFADPSGSDITGAKIGEFTGKAFESALEGGEAVLKVPVADFGGGSLTTSDTTVALVRNGTHTTGIVICTVIEE